MIWVLSIGYAMEGPGIETDEVYAEVRKEFGEEEVVNLSLAIMTINCWNRLAIGLRKIPGEYRPHKTVKPVIVAHQRKDRSDA